MTDTKHTTERFLEFVSMETGEVGKRVNITGYSERMVEKCLRGMLINIHPDWFVRDTADE
jgi:hypothetical protein